MPVLQERQAKELEEMRRAQKQVDMEKQKERAARYILIFGVVSTGGYSGNFNTTEHRFHCCCSKYVVIFQLLFSAEQEKAESAASSPMSESAEMEIAEPETKESDPTETAEAKKTRLREEMRQKRKAVSTSILRVVNVRTGAFAWQTVLWCASTFTCRCENKST